MSKQRRNCAFCGEPGKLTKEHLFSAWIQEVIPVREVKHSHMLVSPPGTQLPSFQNRQVAGDMLSRTLRIVCSNCNNTWMSEIVRASKGSLKPMLLGEWGNLDVTDAEKLSAWITLTTMVYEFADLRTLVTPPTERSEFRTSLKPPSQWRIWIASNTSEDPFIFHRALGSFDSRNCPIPGSAHTQLTLLSLGRFVALAISTHHDEIWRYFQHPFATKMARLWPDVTWPKRKAELNVAGQAGADVMNSLANAIFSSAQMQGATVSRHRYHL